MKKLYKYFVLVSILSNFTLYAQPKESITLPEGGKNMQIQVATQLCSLYVTENQEIYNDDQKLSYFEDISYTIIDQKNKSIDKNMPQHVILYADKNVEYSFIDVIKQEVARVKNNIHYKTGAINDLETINKILEFDPYNYRELIPITTIVEEFDNSLEPEMEMVSFGVMNLQPPQASLVEYLYAKDTFRVLEGLELFSTYTYINFKDNVILDCDGKVLNEETLKQVLPENGLVFIRFDEKLLYGDYIKSTLFLDKVRKELNDNSQLQFRPFEASSELESHFEALSIPFKK